MPTDWGIAVIQLLGEGICYGNGNGTYQQLIDTWCDAQAVPSQAALDAAYATWQANEAALATIRAWVISHRAQHFKFSRALYELDHGLEIATVNLAGVQAVLNAVLAVINTLPQSYLDQLDKYRQLHQVTTAPNSSTLAQCRDLEKALRAWLNSRDTLANSADSVNV